MSLLHEIALETLRTLVLASPFLLFGLLVAGLLHVLLPTAVIQRWLGRPGMSGVSMAALIGVPLPVCSCGVVPISVELKRKGASNPASLSFLTTTPESSIDSIFFTYALMGPVLAIARPLAAFFTALLGGVLAIAYLPTHDDVVPEPVASCGDCGDGGHDDHGHSVGSSDAPAALAALRGSWRRLASRLARRPAEESGGPGVWRTVLRPALRYGFGELLDDLAFWLVVGIVLAGVLGAVLPADLGERGLGAGIVPMLLMLGIGIPLYMCASASTPIAAALLAKGISPGAALVFLLAGPATNAATLVLLGRTFGRRFIQIYLASVVLGALVAGLALDVLVVRLGWQIRTPLVGEAAAGYAAVEWLAALVLATLLFLRLVRGAWRSGWNELRAGFEGLYPQSVERRAARRRLQVLAAATAVVFYLLTGLRTVPPDSRGYLFRFGELVAAELEPGLHHVWPPIERLEVRRTRLARKTDVGFKTDLGLLARRRELVRAADPDEWHSTVAAMNTNPEQATYLTADENLLEMSFTVHYGLTDPAAFFYSLDHAHDLVNLYAEAAARRFLARNPLEELLTSRREEVEEGIHESLAEALAALAIGVEVRAVRIVDVHPPGGAVHAFRDVSSAREDRETRIHRAREVQAGALPQARGEAALLEAQARARADAAVIEASGRSEAFVARAGAAASAPQIVEHLLWIESAERLLAGREKLIVPAGAAGGRVTLWREEPGADAGSKDHR